MSKKEESGIENKNPHFKDETAYSLGLNLLSCGEKNCESGESEQEKNGCYRLCFVISGNGFVFSGNNKYSVREKMTFFLHRDNEITCQAGALTPWNYVWFEMSGKACEPLLQGAGLGRDHPIAVLNKTILDMARIAAFDLGNGMEKRPGDTLRAASVLLSLFAWMEDHAAEAPEPQSSEFSAPAETRGESKALHYVEYMENYFQTHLGERIRMDDLAAEMGIAPYHMSHIYKAVRGISPTSCLTRMRMTLSKEQLANTNRPIGEIAGKCGYDNPLIFSKAFHKNVGCSPRDYRKKMKNTS